MEKTRAAALLLSGLVAGVVIGSAGAPSGPRATPRPEAAAASPEPSPTPARPSRRVDRILHWFLFATEDELPAQGILGGTMRATALGFPESFAGRAGDVFYVLLEDGHAVVTYRYVMRTRRSWKPQEHRQGERLDGWGPGREETVVWRYVGPSFQPEQEGRASS